MRVPEAQRQRDASRWAIDVYPSRNFPGLRRVGGGWCRFKGTFRTTREAKAIALTALEDVEIHASRVVQTYAKYASKD